VNASDLLWGVFQYDVLSPIPAAFEAGRQRALAAAARCGGSALDTLTNAPFLAIVFDSEASRQAFAQEGIVVRWSPGNGPLALDLPSRASSACLALLDEGAPDPAQAGTLDLDVRGDARPFGHPSRILRTLAEGLDPGDAVLAVGLSREARQWPWMRALDHAVTAGVRLILLSWGRLPMEEPEGWDLLETTLECLTVSSGVCTVAAAGNSFRLEPALLPARSPLVLGVGGLCFEEGRWESYDANCFGPRVTNELCALVDDPTSGGGGTSFAAARVAPRLARWLADHPRASAQELRAVAMVSAVGRAVDPHGYHDVEGRVGKGLGLGEPDEERMQQAMTTTGRGRGSIPIEVPARVVIAWNPRPFDGLFRARGPRRQTLYVDAPGAFAADSWLVVETEPRWLAIDTARDCPWAAAWRPL
jgi:hypothetical protein